MTGKFLEPHPDQLHRDHLASLVGALEDITGDGLGELLAEHGLTLWGGLLPAGDLGQRSGQLRSEHGLTVEQHHGDNTAIHR